jgi:hypothetical protein
MKASEISGSDQRDEIINFLKFACKELDITSCPKINLIQEPVSNNISNSFAAYSPDKKRIFLYVKNRHILDILRSLCHELVHHIQNLKGELNDNSGETGSPQENEANSVAGQIMRKYNKTHPELF